MNDAMTRYFYVVLGVFLLLFIIIMAKAMGTFSNFVFVLEHVVFAFVVAVAYLGFVFGLVAICERRKKK